MKTYILFVFGNFDDHEDIEYFCLNVLGDSGIISSLKYVIDNYKNVIVIFDSDKNQDSLTKELDELLNNENIIFYFLFKKEDLLFSYIPETMSNLIFKPSNDILKIEVLHLDNKEKKSLNLDDLLDKIKKSGIDSLSTEERNFLDNFEN